MCFSITVSFVILINHKLKQIMSVNEGACTYKYPALINQQYGTDIIELITADRHSLYLAPMNIS
jgi:hypothetical protein